MAALSPLFQRNKNREGKRSVKSEMASRDPRISRVEVVRQHPGGNYQTETVFDSSKPPIEVDITKRDN